YDMAGWFAAVGPAGLSSEKVKEIHAGITQAFNNADVKKSMAAQGNTIQIMSPQETAAYFQSELKKYAVIVKNAEMELK
ncbi:MAG TPA: tripartite tricarboxylate transporter substrate-binding protein, partial [Candidimonas sp.]|nr:tripartite tricarboxylate transporter substrate-binding protein [Candidimonas sp.]